MVKTTILFCCARLAINWWYSDDQWLHNLDESPAKMYLFTGFLRRHFDFDFVCPGVPFFSIPFMMAYICCVISRIGNSKFVLIQNSCVHVMSYMHIMHSLRMHHFPDHIRCYETFGFMMSLQVMFLGDMLCNSRTVGVNQREVH